MYQSPYTSFIYVKFKTLFVASEEWDTRASYFDNNSFYTKEVIDNNLCVHILTYPGG